MICGQCVVNVVSVWSMWSVCGQCGQCVVSVVSVCCRRQHECLSTLRPTIQQAHHITSYTHDMCQCVARCGQCVVNVVSVCCRRQHGRLSTLRPTIQHNYIISHHNIQPVLKLRWSTPERQCATCNFSRAALRHLHFLEVSSRAP